MRDVGDGAVEDIAEKWNKIWTKLILEITIILVIICKKK